MRPVAAGEFEGRFHSLGAAVAKECHFQPGRSETDKLGSQSRRQWVDAGRREAWSLLGQGTLQGSDHGGMIVAEVQRPKARDEIEEGTAVTIEQLAALAADEGLHQSGHLTQAGEHRVDKPAVAHGGTVGQFGKRRQRWRRLAGARGQRPVFPGFAVGKGHGHAGQVTSGFEKLGQRAGLHRQPEGHQRSEIETMLLGQGANLGDPIEVQIPADGPALGTVFQREPSSRRGKTGPDRKRT